MSNPKSYRTKDEWFALIQEARKSGMTDAGREKEDYSGFYFDRIVEYVNKTLDDPKNKGREAELLDEVGEIDRYIKGEVTKDYIMTYC